MRSALRLAASQMGHERVMVLGRDAVHFELSTINSGGERGAARGRVWPVRKRQQVGNRVVFGLRVTTLRGRLRGRERRRAVARTGKKRPKNGRRREFTLSASLVTGVFGRLAADRKAPRVGFEPTTNRLTAGCSTVELSGKNGECVG